MSWLRIDSGFTTHPKVAPLSDVAFRLHVTALCFCCAHLTDGHIPAGLPRTWPATARGAALRRAIGELVTAGLWEPEENGWNIHDFLDWNPPAEYVRATRQARQEAGKRGGIRSAMAKAKAKQVLEQTGSKPEAEFNPVPVPVPVPIDPAADAAGSTRAAAAADRDLTDSEAETVCPLDLYDRARDGGVLRQLSDKLAQPLVSVEDAAREFVAYWTIGGGAGQRRRHWLAKLRQQVVKRAEGNQLRAPGAIAHGGDSNVTPIHPDVAKFLAGGRT